MNPEMSASILARMFGYNGPADQRSIDQFLAANPAAAARMGKYEETMNKMVSGKPIRGFQTGGSVKDIQKGQQQLVAQSSQPLQKAEIEDIAVTPGLMSTGAGQVTGTTPTVTPTTVSGVSTAAAPKAVDAATMTATTVTPGVTKVTKGLEPEQGTVSTGAIVDAAQQTTTSVSDLTAAQGTAILMDNPVQRKIQDGELISGVADAATAAQFTEQVEAATATPTKQATVQGQLEGLMAQFEGGDTPAWAAGAMRAATAAMAARGLGASSLAGQAVVQAAMEAALPIAAADAQTIAQFEAQNLSNRQQRAMLAAQQRAAFIGQEFDQAFQARVANAARIADVANMNFTAEQQVALENSRIANTMNLQNLNNNQAMVMAEAAALANLDVANLNNRQQAAVQNAQSFLQMDMANLNYRQQTELFKAQQNIQALFTDQAARNAAAQFNASSENQTNQFFSSLAAQTSQFNAAQRNAINQFNAGEKNTIKRFNAELREGRARFNAENALVVEQANAQWRQNVTTLNTAAQNEANMEYAKSVNALSSAALAQIWQRERDVMSYAFTAQQSGLDRALSVLLADKDLDAVREQIASKESTYRSAFLTDLLFGGGKGGSSGSIFDLF